ncbi:RNA polymerase sigma-70 factor [Nocardia goodfellowii]|uniref:RNA polymerase sigma-70 factor (ECF subfamily) n=1 Tax=Nocardia goodfellowii TaxID=882446 RepID=A0ABS4QKJ5_9NOCA|nr:RNA polymerase sigma-70 factor [Nocardia goodfellowii]MBP2192227.1 RNA polymerase sigma-70 factor (ECF subfamily) [Nocardia goodfellowii]
MNTPSDAELGRAIAEFSQLRGRLFGIAYRMLGSVADAEDILQDVWVKWQSYDERDAVRDSTAFLVTMTTRLSINATQTARVRRETYVGPWLPEPVDTSADPSLGAERAAVLETAVLVVLEKLTPTERAAFVLREAFDYPYDEIAEILHMKQPAARKLVSRARQSIESDRHTPVDTTDQRRLLSAFLVAARAGDFDALETLFADDVASYSDGGGKVRNASRIPVFGRLRVAKYVTAFASHFWTGVTLDWVDANGRPSVLIRRDGAPIAWLTVGVAGDERIDRIFWVFNPAKLTRITQVVAARGDSTAE